MAKHESKFWLELKNKTPNISWTRIENTSTLGTPDLLGYNKNQHFFTVELKVIKGNSKPRFSPHQISFHVKHPTNSFIFIKQKTLVASCYKLYTGSQILSLVTCDVKMSPVACDLLACAFFLENV